VHGKRLKRVVTLLVMSDFERLPGAPGACVDFREPSDFSRLNKAEK